MALVSKDDNKLSIVRQCQLLEVSRSSHYHEPKGESKQNLALMEQIDRMHLEHPYFGAERMAKHLSTPEVQVNVKRIRRLMREMDISAIYPVPNTSEACKWHKTYPYLLRNLKIDRNNMVWSMDITYIPMPKGFMYLCAIIDWNSRYLLSWTLSNTMTVEFCLEALEKAISIYGAPEILNTDQGSQFTSEGFTTTVLGAEIRLSMDGIGRATDNIAIERFWRSIKYENIYLNAYDSTLDLYKGIHRYVEFYNWERKHQGLEYKTPAEVYGAADKLSTYSQLSTKRKKEPKKEKVYSSSNRFDSLINNPPIAV
ncbi:IS3 family transposase [Chitinophaga sp. LS1]|uniref:IS3 family transposase n=1 Tax=Chitinophaga sp. LS1 TaxID=3051176 RepID=UPI002AAAF957|nr:IS3 family transposase [Chitinophaga sp. LS1]WPV66027.1 IS3 family transposase [Chitinophaga sp. LS1]WPV67400.1 IS3 family transposase [Chitinophaga sp. LS1]